MARLTTFYDDAFNDHLKSQKAVSKTPAENLDLATFAKRVGRMADTGAGITRIDLERYIGRNDLLRFNYLSRGLQAGKAVCRIYVADKFGGGGSWGTGFLISPSLIITNHHVIPDSDSASRAFAEFGYEADNNGLLLQGARFILQPQKTFVTSPVDALDISIIAISDLSDNGSTSIADYGFLRMNPGLNKVDEMEFVSIIEHPGADEKYIAIRENKVIKIGDEDPARDTRIWYESDTIEGASGAGVFNDQWQVVAVHHSAVAETRIDANSKTEVHLVNDEWVLKNDDNIYPAEPHYIANEGIRISKIIAFIQAYINNEGNQQNNLGLLREFLDDVMGIKPITPNVKESIASSPLTGAILTEVFRAPSRNVWPVEHYTGRIGYQENFLNVHIPFPTVGPNALKHGPLTPVAGTTDNLLRYTHYSLYHNSERKIAFVTGVNIDGKSWQNIKRGDDKWYYDARVPLEVQLGDELYSGEPSSFGSKGYFDRGHLVRRQDPDWGAIQEAAQADEDTFHWLNCSPQYWEFNQGKELWQGLENYILYNTDQEDIKASVFTGPIFDINDELHRGVKIPQYFFKIVAVTDVAGKLFASAYVVSQQKWAQHIPFEVLPVGDYNHFQTTISKIEDRTGLAFSDSLKNADTNTGGNDKGLRTLADIKHPRR